MSIQRKQKLAWKAAGIALALELRRRRRQRQAQLLARMLGLFPGITTNVLAAVNRFLPAAAEGQPERVSGRQSETALTRSFVAALSQRAMRRLNQLPASETEREGGGVASDQHGIVSTG